MSCAQISPNGLVLCEIFRNGTKDAFNRSTNLPITFCILLSGCRYRYKIINLNKNKIWKQKFQMKTATCNKVLLYVVLVPGINLNSLAIYNGLIGQKIKQNEVQSKSNVRNAEDGIFGRSFSITYNVLRIYEVRLNGFLNYKQMLVGVSCIYAISSSTEYYGRF